MTNLPIRFYGDPVLREKAQPVAQPTDELRQLAADMGETMYAAGGIGLAANQIGDLRRILVLDVTDRGEKRSKKRATPGSNLETFLNPEIIETSVEDEAYNEGCLSIPGVEGDVFRPIRLRLRWLDLDGNTREEDFDGMHARVLQHEIDHLDGVLFIDHLPEPRRAAIAPQLAQIRRQHQAD